MIYRQGEFIHENLFAQWLNEQEKKGVRWDLKHVRETRML
jgi:hypothetical protein